MLLTLKAPHRFVADTNVLSNFSITGKCSLLRQLYDSQLCTTVMVMEELQQGLNSGYDYLQDAVDVLAPTGKGGWLSVVSLTEPQEQSLYTKLSTDLGRGEASCLAVALFHNMTLICDDLSARRMADQLSITKTGTLGVLIRLVREKIVDLETANLFLRQMITYGYHSPIEQLDSFIP